MNAQTIEAEILNTCKSYFKEQAHHNRLNERIIETLEHQKMKHKQTQITQAQLIEKLAQNQIDIETFKRLSTSSESEERYSNYSHKQITETIRHIIKDKLTLETIAPLIDDITITQTKQLQGIYFKNSPLNIVEQSHLIPHERNENL
mgnify:CR=1 FL=1